MELYVERGFERTTVADIAERAGPTERTFFRHFADKREVLFYGQDEFVELFVSAAAGAPDDATSLDVVVAAAANFEPRRPSSRTRQSIIYANLGLPEHELIKLAHLSSAIAATLRDRGVDDRPPASLRNLAFRYLISHSSAGSQSRTRSSSHRSSPNRRPH